MTLLNQQKIQDALEVLVSSFHADLSALPHDSRFYLFNGQA